MMRNVIVILGDQLNLDNPALEGFNHQQDMVLMIEAPNESTHVWSHKARIALFLSAMRHFALTLQSQHYPLRYLKLGDHDYIDLASAWLALLSEYDPQQIIVCEMGDYRVLKVLEDCASTLNKRLIVRDDTFFLCSQADFKRWAGQGKQLRMEYFYRYMRKRYQVLMAGEEPIGGKWNYDHENRKSFSKDGPQNIPAVPQFEIDQITQAAFADVEQFFPEHPGKLDHFCWPVTRAQALLFLQHFIATKLVDFGVHQDAMWQSDLVSGAFLWHSLLSSSLNLKLLHPKEVIEAVEQAYEKNNLPLASVEGFVRQILGWREFIRGLYWLDMPAMAQANHYEHQRDLPNWYWTGKTNMNCMRQTITQTMQYGYAHHIQRLMVTGMFGLLAEIEPKQVADWYLAVYVDAVDWVELPNVIGMALHANGGRFTSKPYIASGAYIKRMSNYCNSCSYQPEIKTSAKACPVTTLYWNFLIKHEQVMLNNPRTVLMVKNLNRFNNEEKTLIQQKAQKVLHALDEI
jgi:deoxyribodipyrimidine photolyase-related protein